MKEANIYHMTNICPCYESNSRGIAILFKNTFGFTYISMKHNSMRNFLMLDIELDSCNKFLTLVAVYGPYETDVLFYYTLVQ